MNSRFRKLGVESLEGRSVLSTMVEADFNGDDYLDLATLTDYHTITVSLFDPADGGYDVSAILTTPKNQPLQNLLALDYEDDGDLDITAVAAKPSGDQIVQYWLNDGDGSFEYLEPFEPIKWRGPRPRWAF